MIDRQRDNPFDLTKASDYSDRQIQDYWVDVASDTESLVDLLKPTSKMPMLLLGGKGSGKTHLMRYCSSSVQALRHGSVRDAMRKEGYLGIYSQADGLNASRFSGKGQTEELWASVFAYSFELWLAGHLLVSFRPAIEGHELESAEWNAAFAKEASAIFHGADTDLPCSYDSFIEHLKATRQRVDHAINNASITRRLEGVNITFNPGELAFGLPSVISRLCELARDSIFVYLIDEVENFTEMQQRFLNSLVRYRRGNSTVKIGARLYGIKTANTLGSGEPIKRDAEYERVQLDDRLRESESKYENLARSLVQKRIEPLNINVKDLNNIDALFSELDSADYFRVTACSITAARDRAGLERPHLARFRKVLERAYSDRRFTAHIVTMLALPEHPLLEKVNLLAFYKRSSTNKDIATVAKDIHDEARSLLQFGNQGAPSYYELYSHFAADLLAQLSRDFGRKPTYAGFKTLIRISQGVPRNLLSLLKHIYRRSSFAGESPFQSGPISVEAQTLGVQDAAEWFWEDAQPDEYGSLVRNAVENLATLLRGVRYSDNPAECDPCTFSLNVARASENCAKALQMAENWSFIMKVSGASGAKNDDRILSKFQINPMLSARWGISASRRGVLELKNELAEHIFSENTPASTREAISGRLEAMNLPRTIEAILDPAGRAQQPGLFDDV